MNFTKTELSLLSDLARHRALTWRIDGNKAHMDSLNNLADRLESEANAPEQPTDIVDTIVATRTVSLNHFHGKAVPIAYALNAIASQENCDSEEYNLMVEAAEYISDLERNQQPPAFNLDIFISGLATAFQEGWEQGVMGAQDYPDAFRDSRTGALVERAIKLRDTGRDDLADPVGFVGRSVTVDFDRQEAEEPVGRIIGDVYTNGDRYLKVEPLNTKGISIGSTLLYAKVLGPIHETDKYAVARYTQEAREAEWADMQCWRRAWLDGEWRYYHNTDKIPPFAGHIQFKSEDHRLMFLNGDKK